MTCPRCKCPECAKVELNAVLARRIVARETISPRDLPFVEQHNAALLRDIRERESWRDTYVDPDAEQLARDVLDCARAG